MPNFVKSLLWVGVGGGGDFKTNNQVTPTLIRFVKQCDLLFVLLYNSDDCGQHAALVSYVKPTNMHVLLINFSHSTPLTRRRSARKLTITQ